MFGGGHVGKKLNMVGESDDSVLDEGCTQYLRQSLLKLLILGGETEGLKELEPTHQWSGIWGTSKDHYPWEVFFSPRLQNHYQDLSLGTLLGSNTPRSHSDI